MKFYRAFSISAASTFAAVGLVFILFPAGVVSFFNSLSLYLRMPLQPLPHHDFYVVLAGGYMYVVTVFAWRMYRDPTNRFFPLMLAHAKIASSLLSIVLFICQDYYLIYLVNFLVDGSIGVAAAVIFHKMKGAFA